MNGYWFVFALVNVEVYLVQKGFAAAESFRKLQQSVALGVSLIFTSLINCNQNIKLFISSK